MNTTARSSDWLKKRGWIVSNVEKFNSFIKRRFDAFGLGDLLAARPETGIGLIQCTTGSNAAAHVDKALEQPYLIVWLRSGGSFHIHAWSLAGPRGKRKKWTLRILEAVIESNGEGCSFREVEPDMKSPVTEESEEPMKEEPHSQDSSSDPLTIKTELPR